MPTDIDTHEDKTMSLHPRQKQRIGLLIAFIIAIFGASQYESDNAQPADKAIQADQYIVELFQSKSGDVQVELSGTVSRLLPDDEKGSRHQRFIITLMNGHTLLIAHNIDLAPRIDNLKTGDMVTVYGEYEWNQKGGVMHWTHHDPANKHPHGWIRHNNQLYQ
jgi:hypothetical protein